MKGYKVYERIKNLKQKGYGKRRAAREVKNSRETINKYWEMSEEEYAQSVIGRKSRTKTLDPYREYIERQISEHHEITCAIIYDHLREEYPELEIAPRNVWEYVMLLREELGLPTGRRIR